MLIPANAGVGSAVGLLRAPVAYEIVRGRLTRLGSFDAAAANRLCAEMHAEAEAIVRRGAPGAELTEQRSAFMRYRGQGHEIAVPLPVRDFTAEDRSTIAELFEAAYRRLYSRAIPGVEIEILSWVVFGERAGGRPARRRDRGTAERAATARRDGRCFDPDVGELREVPILLARRSGARRMHQRAGHHRRGRDLDGDQPAFRRHGSTASATLSSPAARLEIMVARSNAALAQIHTQIMWNRLIAVVEEQAQTMLRTAFSTPVREAGDLSAGVFDCHGRMLAQAVTGTPGHVNSMAERGEALPRRPIRWRR